MATSQLTIRIDNDVKEQFDRVLKALGLNMTTAIDMFARTTIRQNAIPFALTLEADEGYRKQINATLMERAEQLEHPDQWLTTEQLLKQLESRIKRA